MEQGLFPGGIQRAGKIKLPFAKFAGKCVQAQLSSAVVRPHVAIAHCQTVINDVLCAQAKLAAKIIKIGYRVICQGTVGYY